MGVNNIDARKVAEKFTHVSFKEIQEPQIPRGLLFVLKRVPNPLNERFNDNETSGNKGDNKNERNRFFTKETGEPYSYNGE